jgi:hypothetical protein
VWDTGNILEGKLQAGQGEIPKFWLVQILIGIIVFVSASHLPVYILTS